MKKSIILLFILLCVSVLAYSYDITGKWSITEYYYDYSPVESTDSDTMGQIDKKWLIFDDYTFYINGVDKIREGYLLPIEKDNNFKVRFSGDPSAWYLKIINDYKFICVKDANGQDEDAVVVIVGMKK